MFIKKIEEINKGKQREDLYSWTISIGNWLLLCSCKSNKFEVIEVSIFWYSLRPEESHKEGIFRSVVLEGQLVRRSNELFPWKWMTMKIIPSPVPHWRIEDEPRGYVPTTLEVVQRMLLMTGHMPHNPHQNRKVDYPQEEKRVGQLAGLEIVAPLQVE